MTYFFFTDAYLFKISNKIFKKMLALSFIYIMFPKVIIKFSLTYLITEFLIISITKFLVFVLRSEVSSQTRSFCEIQVFWKILLKFVRIKGALYGLRQFLITESPLKMMKNAFYFTLKALFVLKIFKFLSWLFDYVEKTARLER